MQQHTKASRPRQVAAARARAAASGDRVCKTVCEVVSGCLPTQQRKEFLSLLECGGVSKIYIESCRAMARSAHVAEELWSRSAQHGVEIVPADLPGLLKHDATPVEQHLRRIVFATTELERDLTVTRLQDGLRRKMLTTSLKTQSGAPKVNGTRSLLDIMKPKPCVVRKLRQLAAKHKKTPAFGLRSLAAAMSEALSLPRTMAHETARRMCSELLLKK